jgi:hypothetical protein
MGARSSRYVSSRGGVTAGFQVQREQLPGYVSPLDSAAVRPVLHQGQSVRAKEPMDVAVRSSCGSRPGCVDSHQDLEARMCSATCSMQDLFTIKQVLVPKSPQIFRGRGEEKVLSRGLTETSRVPATLHTAEKRSMLMKRGVLRTSTRKHMRVHREWCLLSRTI